MKNMKKYKNNYEKTSIFILIPHGLWNDCCW